MGRILYLSILLTISYCVQGQMQKIDDFENHTVNATIDGVLCDGAAGGLWDTADEGDGSIKVVNGKALSISEHNADWGAAAGFNGVTDMISDYETGAVFFRFKVAGGTESVTTFMGVHKESGSGEGPLYWWHRDGNQADDWLVAGFALMDSGISGQVKMVYLEDTSVTLQDNLFRDQWYDVWIVINRKINRYDLYLSEATADAPTAPDAADLVANDLSVKWWYGHGSDPLQGAYFTNPNTGVNTAALYIDDIYMGSVGAGLLGDLSGDDRVGVEDLHLFCEQWLSPDPQTNPVNFNNDDTVSMVDFGLLAGNWKTMGSLDMTYGNVRLTYDLVDGTTDFYWNGVKKIAGFYSGVRIGETYITSRDYAARSCETGGAETIITCTGNDLPTMKQHFVLDADNHFLVQVEMEGTTLTSNWMGPIIMNTTSGMDIGSYGDVRALQVPYDNDSWVRYNAMSINNSETSYEVAAFYDNTSRSGLITGSVTHDTWKTGVDFVGSNNKLNTLAVYGGVANSSTRDVIAHGAIAGSRLYSPKIMVGFFNDWRDGMEEFANVNAAQTPKLNWSGGVPFGWNSWGKIQDSLNYTKAIAVSDFFKDHLQNNQFNNNGTVYINLDSFWDNMSGTQLSSFVSHVHGNGQKAGIYWGPFVYWGSDMNRTVEGTGYKYGDILLRTTDGTPITLDGAYALDPTHTATRYRINYWIDYLRNMGFDYIKLDFLTHGAIEGGSNNGLHYDPAIRTGVQAYNQGMQYVLNRINGSMFVSISIAPLFPYQYAHARRISCDTYGAINETEYVMNSISYGWWMSGRVYAYNDPDHMVLEGHTGNENKSRVTSGAVAGTVFLNGDDVTGATAQGLTQTWLTNNNINAVARLGKPFRPVEGNTSTAAADALVLQDGNTYYLAVFNYNKYLSATKTMSLSRCGLSGSKTYTVTDLWTGNTSTAAGTLSVSLGARESAILKLN